MKKIYPPSHEKEKKQTSRLQALCISLCMLVFFIFAGSQLQAQTLTIQMKDASLEQVLKNVQKTSGYQLFYNSKTAQNVKGISLDLRDASIDEILKQALKGTGLDYAITGTTIVIRARQPEKQVKKYLEVSGTVTDAANEPLIGASVIIQGTTVGVSTDVNGKFTLRIPTDAAALTITFIGYESQNVPILDTDPNRPHVFHVILKEDTEQMEEVVVTGYQTLSKERATGSFSKISNETLELRRMDKLDNMLEGQIVGYSKGQLRGITTMNAIAKPLVVIDGFPVENTTMNRAGETEENMPDLNPEDIESVTVLKDAAAASIYGARAANGVIVITTKKAKQGKTQIDLSATFTVNPYYFYKKNLANAADVVDIEREWAKRNANLQAGGETAANEIALIRDEGAYPNLGVDALLDLYAGAKTPAETEAILSNLASRGYRYYDQVEKYAKQNPLYQQYNMRIGKASERNNFNLSATYWRNRSEDIHSKDDKLSVNLTNTVDITSWLSADVGIYLKYGKETRQTYDPLNPGFSFLPYNELVAADGSHVSAAPQNKKEYRDNIEQYGMYDEIITPMDELGRGLSHTKDFSSRAFAKLNFTFTPWLKYHIMYQYENSFNDSENLREKESYYTRTMINKFSSWASYGKLIYNLPDGDIYRTEDHKTTAYNFRHQLDFEKTFAEKHNIVWIVGNEVRHNKMEYEDNTFYGYDPQLQTWTNIDAQRLNNFDGINGSAQLGSSSLNAKKELVNRFVSIYSNLSYTFDSRYIFSGSIRWDRSNLWGSNIKNQNKPLWSVGGSWLVSKEDFFHVNAIDLLKLRLSYGIGGNIGRNTAPYVIAKYFANTTIGGIYGMVSSPANEDIRWEKTQTTNVGLDFSLFRNRLSGSIEYYNKYSTDLLAGTPGSLTQGVGNIPLTTNNGKMSNRGIELTLNGDIVRAGGFNWNATLLYAYNKNRVKKINQKATSINSRFLFPNTYAVEGKPYNGIFAYRWAHLDGNGDPQVYNGEGNIISEAISDSDVEALKYCGTATPVHTGTFTNIFSYKNLELSVMLLLETGHKIREKNQTRINMGNGFIGTTSKDITNRWRQSGDEMKTDVPRIIYANETSTNDKRSDYYNMSDKFVYDASNLRVHNISVSYRLPQTWTQRLYMNNVQLRFHVENVATLAFEKKALYSLGGKIKPNYVFGLNVNF